MSDSNRVRSAAANEWCRRSLRLGKRLRRTARKYATMMDQYPAQVIALHHDSEQMVDSYEEERNKYSNDAHKARVDMCFNPLLEGKIAFSQKVDEYGLPHHHQAGGKRKTRRHRRRTHH